MGAEQEFANQTEKNVYSNLGVMSKFRTHRLRLQVAKTRKGGCRETVRFRECSFGRVKPSGTELSVGSAPSALYLPPLQLFSLKSHLFHIPSLSTTLESSVEDCSGYILTRPNSWDPA